jgi:Bacterial PH domain
VSHFRSDTPLSADQLDVRYRFRPNIFSLLAAAALSGSVVLHGEWIFAIAIWAALGAILLIGQATLRLTADQDGVRVSNWGNKSVFAWSEIADVKFARGRQQPTLQITLTSGRNIKATALAGSSYERITDVVARLRAMRQEALGGTAGEASGP